MAVSLPRRWWGSRRLFSFTTGLTLLALTVGSGIDTATAGPAEPLRAATVASVTAPTATTISGGVATGLGVTTNSVAPDGSAAGAAPDSHSRAGIAPPDSHSRAGIAPLGTPVGQPVGGSSWSTTARPDARPLTGVAVTPRGPRAPPRHLA
ncbi:hypothetical protein HC028_15350 [Planosporangium flavigriseum]|uniref:Uncharacterized protein n=1 Tax=Planosporangium flavigriseum TaxID=373681 RepID=A0A8J3LQF9_9ACTN|nr:hypothetical protein [Planosporangium flavigriseum]NJC65866.1 hypothetical protein [Planosporangium flavigriseum]GIG76087.1 hypothetical protein Pfl04_44910 [Planosporangium flavigriseum]